VNSKVNGREAMAKAMHVNEITKGAEFRGK
jgi:hypothetical protein